MASKVLRTPRFHIIYSTPVPSTVLDLTCFTVAVEITPETEEIDIGNWCDPAASDLGRTSYSCVATLLWEPALFTALSPHVGEEGLVQLYQETGVPGHVIRFDGSYAAQPWGRFELGQRVEVELPIAVLSEPVWFEGP
jgi:hypothetical protein